MKKLFTRSFIRALMITVISALIIAGGIYAYQTLWSGKAHITIEPPAGEGQLEVTGVTAGSNGSWDDVTNTWTVSIAKGESARLTVHLRNTDGDAVSYLPYIDNHELTTYVAPGVYMQTTGDLSLLAAGESGSIRYSVRAEADAEPGTLPEIQLEIRTD